VPAPRQLRQADRKFLRAAAAGGAAEVELAKLAQRMTKNKDITEFAQRMIRDHQEVNRRIGALAQDAGLPPMQGLDPEHKALHDRLSKLQGGAFDRAYIDSQIVDHQVMAQLLEYEIGSGQDKELKALAAELLPAIFDHLQAADGVVDGLSRSVARQR
jgi:putative membrane protein